MKARSREFSVMLSRRKLLGGVLFGAMLGPLAACSSSPAASPTAAPAATTSAPSVPTAAPTSTAVPTAAATAAPTAATTAAPTTVAAAATAPAAQPAALKPVAGSTLTLLQWSHFVPAYDTWFDNWAKEWGQKNNVTVRVDHVPNVTLPARFAAEVAANSGHDLIEFQAIILCILYQQHLVPVDEIAIPLGQKYGGWTQFAQSIGIVNGKWLGIPSYYILQPLLWRKDLFDKAGIQTPSEPTQYHPTWDDMRIAGSKLKAMGHPTGIAISHCNDSNHNWRAVLWAFGASEVGEDGKTITFDSPATREALKFAKALYDEAMTPEVFGWDDASDNRYLASGVACWLHDAISSWLTTKQTNPDIFPSIYIATEPKGPATGAAAQWANLDGVDANVYAIWNFSKNVPTAKAFLADWADLQQDHAIQSNGYNMPFLNDLFKKPMPVLGSDPKLAVLQDYPSAIYGFPGPPNAAAEEVMLQFIIPDVVAQYVRSGDLEGAIKTGISKLTAIYSKYK